MAATIDDLDFLAPAVASLPAPDKERALAMAADYRPACLPAKLQDEAQLWYAAWLLYGIKAQRAADADGVVARPGLRFTLIRPRRLTKRRPRCAVRFWTSI